jgi:hypothetical protein
VGPVQCPFFGICVRSACTRSFCCSTQIVSASMSYEFQQWTVRNISETYDLDQKVHIIYMCMSRGSAISFELSLMHAKQTKFELLEEGEGACSSLTSGPECSRIARFQTRTKRGWPGGTTRQRLCCTHPSGWRKVSALCIASPLFRWIDVSCEPLIALMNEQVWMIFNCILCNVVAIQNSSN